MPSSEIADYSVTEHIRDGRQVTVRAVRPEDKGPMAGRIRELSSESFYRRTFSPKRELSDKELSRLAEVDFRNVVALVAVLREGDQDLIVGGGRYILLGNTGARSAEVAFLIDDGHQGLGIGSRIFKHLVAIARDSGLSRFEAEVLPSNEGMLRLFDRSGLPVKKVRAEDTVHVSIELAGGRIAPGNDRGGNV